MYTSVELMSLVCQYTVQAVYMYPFSIKKQVEQHLMCIQMLGELQSNIGYCALTVLSTSHIV